jgi:hypothetical protein
MKKSQASLAETDTNCAFPAKEAVIQLAYFALFAAYLAFTAEPTSLEAAWRKVVRNHGAAGVDGQSIERRSLERVSDPGRAAARRGRYPSRPEVTAAMLGRNSENSGGA